MLLTCYALTFPSFNKQFFCNATITPVDQTKYFWLKKFFCLFFSIYFFFSAPRVKCEATYRGGCSNYSSQKIGDGILLSDKVYTVQSCHTKCLENSECEAFFVNPADGRCLLVQDGCVPHANNDGTTGSYYYKLSSCSECKIWHVCF